MTTIAEQPLQQSARTSSPVELFFKFIPDARIVDYTDRRGAHSMPIALKTPDKAAAELLIDSYVSDMNDKFIEASRATNSVFEQKKIAAGLSVYSGYMIDQAFNTDRFQTRATMGMYILEAVQRIASPDRIA